MTAGPTTRQLKSPNAAGATVACGATSGPNAAVVAGLPLQDVTSVQSSSAPIRIFITLRAFAATGELARFQKRRRVFLRAIAAALIGATFAAATGSAQTTSDADRDRGYVIFDATRAAVSHLADPPYVAFTLQDDGHTDYSVQQERLRILVRASDGAAVVVALRNPNGVDVARPSPVVVHGANYQPMSYILRLGDFTLYDFGLRYGVRNRPGFFDAPGTPEPEATPVRAIASVRAFNTTYRIVDLGDTTIDNHPVYHLGLTPLRDLGHHMLREMWIDRTSYLPLRYLAELPVHYADSGQVVEQDATIDTAVLDGHLTNARVDGRFRILVGVAEKSGTLKWTVSDVSFPASVPDWVFDLAQWPQHLGETIPNLAP